MELLYVVTAQCFFGVLLFSYFGVTASIAGTLFIISIALLFCKKISMLFVIFPLIMLLRVGYSVDTTTYNVGDIINIETKLDGSRGKIEKINEKIPSKKTYCQIDNFADGRYRAECKIIKILEKNGNITYQLSVYQNQKIELTGIEKYFRKKVSHLTDRMYLEQKNLYTAVILGDASRLDKNMRDMFAYTGSSHLLALSGLHMGLIYGSILYIMSKVPISRRKRYMITLLCLLLYFCGVNRSPSFVRAFIMVAISICGKIFYEDVDIMKSLCFSFLVGMFISPVSVGEISLKLSYLAVFAIIALFPKIKEKIYDGRSKILDMLILSTVIQIFVLPITLTEFGKISILSVFSNMILMPLGSIYISVSFIGLLLENIGLGILVLPFIKLTYNIFYYMLIFFNKIPFLTVECGHKLSNFVIFGFYGIIFLVVAYGKIKENGEQENGKILERNKI